MRKLLLAAALAGGLSACGENAPVSAPLAAPPAARSTGAAIPGQYIVLFKPALAADLASNATRVQSEYGGVVERIYSPAINGVVMQIADDAADALRADPRVLLVEQDQVVSKSTVQTNATWGIDRIDQRTRPLSTTYSYVANGTGVTVYILDTGINFGQADFGGRAVKGTDVVTPGGTATDCDGHGTHVSGTVGSATYGVAKNVRLVAVRVLDCFGDGTVSGVIAGIDWVTNNRVLPAVANMSLGGSASTALDNAVQSSINMGVTYAVAAGNSTANACTQSPARAPNAITVGATTITDGYASYSNFGSCVDILAPGSSITSWWLGAGPNTISGTSMASPHVAGAAALYLQTTPGATPLQVRNALVNNATPNVITSVPAGTPNLLLYTGFIAANLPPTASITAPVDGSSVPQGTSVTFTGSGSDPEDGALSGASLVWTSNRDGQIGTGTTFSRSNLSVGQHVITLRATDAQGASGTATTNITITQGNNQAPVARFTWSCPGMQCTMDASTSTDDVGIVRYSWNWGDGRTENRVSPIAKNTWQVASIYTVTLTVTDGGGLTNSVSRQVSVPNQAPVAAITAPPAGSVFLLGAPVTLTGTGTDLEDGALGGAALTWSSDVDGVLGTGGSLTTSGLSAGTHLITLTVRDALNATGTATRTIVINRPPTAQVTAPAPNSSYPAGSAVTFTGTGTDPEDGALSGAALAWASNVDGALGTGASLTTSSLSVGPHVITLTATDSRGATHSATVNVTITSVNTNQPPVARFTWTCPTLQCTLDASTSSDDAGVVKYFWNWGNGRSETKLGPIVRNTWAVAGTYTVTLTVTDAGGLTNSVSHQVTVPSP